MTFSSIGVPDAMYGYQRIAVCVSMYHGIDISDQRIRFQIRQPRYQGGVNVSASGSVYHIDVSSYLKQCIMYKRIVGHLSAYRYGSNDMLAYRRYNISASKHL